MRNHSIILYSNNHQAEQALQELLRSLSIAIDIAHSKDAVVNFFKVNEAKVLLLCFDEVSDGVNKYLELVDEHDAIKYSTHRTITICSGNETALATGYCLDAHIDNYFVLDQKPSPHRLQLIIEKSFVELKNEDEYRNCTSYLSALKEQSKILDNFVEDSFKDCQNIIDFSISSFTKLIQVFDKELNTLMTEINNQTDSGNTQQRNKMTGHVAKLRLDSLNYPVERLRKSLAKFNKGWSDDKFKVYCRLSRKIHVSPSLVKSTGARKILIVDDDELFRDIMVAMLEAEDYIVLTAADGEQALETLRHSIPDVIVLDIDMPVMSGIELLKIIRAEVLWDEIPVLMLTGQVDEETLQTSIKAGANGFFAKPGSELQGIETIDSLFKDDGVLQTRHNHPAPLESLLTKEQRSSIKPLIIDDDIFMQEIIGLLLDNLELVEWKAVSGGEKALQLLQSSEQYNVLILDLNMPDMDGIELLRHLAERRYTGAIIIISGYGSRLLRSVENLGNAHKLNLVGSLGKPITPLKLAEMLNRVKPGPMVQQALIQHAWKPAIEDIRKAIDNDEFILYYQPKIEMQSKKLVGVEALARWQHPQRGIIEPFYFIDLAEKNGLIEDLTNKVLRIAIAQHLAWKAADYDIPVSVNIASPVLDNLAFPKFLSSLVDELGMPPEKLTLEITETGLITNFTNALDVLNRLRLRGFKLAIDDFGTGDSSFMKLKQMPFDQLKIDREFMHGATHDKHAHAIVDASVILSQQFNLELVAEGIENHEDWIFSQNAGCKIIQGYFMSRPLPAEEIIPWIENS